MLLHGATSQHMQADKVKGRKQSERDSFGRSNVAVGSASMHAISLALNTSLVDYVGRSSF